MAKVIIAGTTANIVSTLTLEEIKKAEKYSSEALKLYDEKSKNEVFTIGTSATGDISKYGISFSSKTFDGEEKATVAIQIPDGTANAKKYISENYGATLMAINKVETQVVAVLETVGADLANIENNITIA